MVYGKPEFGQDGPEELLGAPDITTVDEVGAGVFVEDPPAERLIQRFISSRPCSRRTLAHTRSSRSPAVCPASYSGGKWAA